MKAVKEILAAEWLLGEVPEGFEPLAKVGHGPI
jgi:hypothetical protein